MSNSDTAAPNKLYEAAVNFLVSDRTNTNTWEQVATFVHEYHQMCGSDPDFEKNLKREFRIVEQQVRKDFNVTRLPAAWRSTKATSIGAVRIGLPLVLRGDVQPKTDVGKLICAAKKGTLTRTDFDQFKNHFNAAYHSFTKLSGTELDDATAMLVGWIKAVPLAAVMTLSS